MYTLRQVCNAVNRKFADFIIDNTMMRKLYSVNKKDDPLFLKEEELTKPESLNHGPMADLINSRTSFYYTYK